MISPDLRSVPFPRPRTSYERGMLKALWTFRDKPVPPERRLAQGLSGYCLADAELS